MRPSRSYNKITFSCADRAAARAVGRFILALSATSILRNQDYPPGHQTVVDISSNSHQAVVDASSNSHQMIVPSLIVTTL